MKISITILWRWMLIYALYMFAFEANTAQKMKFFIKHFFSKCDQIHCLLRIWSSLLTKSLTENFIFCAVKKWLILLIRLSTYNYGSNDESVFHRKSTRLSPCVLQKRRGLSAEVLSSVWEKYSISMQLI